MTANVLAAYQAGPSSVTHFVQTAGGGSVTSSATRPGGDQMNGNAVMYHTGQIVTFGGGPDYQSKPAVKATSLITLNGFTATARASTPMHFERAYCTGVVFPDGKVIVMGGQPFPIPFDDTNSVLPTGAAHSRSIMLEHDSVLYAVLVLHVQHFFRVALHARKHSCHGPSYN